MSFERCRNVLDYAIDVSHHIIVPIAKDEVAHCCQNLRSLRVGLCLHSMLPAIELNNQMSVSAKEIDDKAVEGELSPEFPSGEAAIAQTKPQLTFGVRLIAA